MKNRNRKIKKGITYWVSVRKDNEKMVSHTRVFYDIPFAALYFRKKDCLAEIGKDKDFFKPRKIILE